MTYPWPFTDARDSHEPPERSARLHPSWKALEVARSASSCDEARARLLPRFDIPTAVLEQWVCAHYFNDETRRNYGWIDYDCARFDLERWSTAQFLVLRVIAAYRSFVERWAAAEQTLAETPLAARSGDAEVWRREGTWRLPPVVIDPVGFGTPPSDADITSAPQLVEGHTRLGNLRRFLRLGPRSAVQVTDEHTVYVLRAR